MGLEVIGVAVSGSTAERLGADSPALAGHTMTVDALVARATNGRLEVGPDTTVILDEAGMVDHKRMDALTDLVERSGAKLIAVGDGKQLPSIGPGGMFDRLAHRAPTAELQDIHRTSDPQERKAWAALRAGEPERAMAHYKSRQQLFFTNTREQAGEAAVQRWAELTETRPIRDVALIADASNVEIDRLNARAQHLRAQRGELGPNEVALPHQHYGLREGDLVAFTKQHRTPGRQRVENGSRGEVTAIDARGGLDITLDGSNRPVSIAREELESLRLGYAQHVYRQQGATVERSVVVTGGWQTSRESAYVQASRARQGTEFFLAREELGLDGLDAGRVEKLAEKMRSSRAQLPSILYRALTPDVHDIGEELQRSTARQLAPDLARPLDRKPDRDQSRGISR
jgi:ATP-dependent exoDNAse (exonuclease V) alpha subunit